MNNKTSQSWNNHYTRDTSMLAYPDEQLVRMIKKNTINKHRALDAGCGTGRHVKLLNENGFDCVIGVDISYNALKQSQSLLDNIFIQCSIDKLPFGDSSFDAVIAWGSLHYAQKELLPCMLAEIKRVLSSEGIAYGTLRSAHDTYIARGKHLGNNTWETSLPDIQGAVISLYSLNEVKKYLGIFKEFHIGLMERTVLDELDKKLSHWYFYAKV